MTASSIPITWIRVVLASAGAFVAGTLTLGHFMERDLPCGEGGGCAAVSADAWASIGPIPVAAVGLAAYLLIGLVSVWGAGSERVQTLLRGLTGFGFLASVAFVLRSVFVVEATCHWCLGSAVLMTLLFLTTVSPKPLAAGRLIPNVMASILLVVAASLAIPFTSGAVPKVPHDAKALAEMPLEVLVPDDAHSIGRPDAPVILVEFADLQCAACKRFFPTAKRLVEGLKGLRLVFRHLPLLTIRGHQESGKIAAFAEIAGEDGDFWRYVEDTYALPGTDDLKPHEEMMERLGFDWEAVKKRVENEEDRAVQRVFADMRVARDLKLRQTPTLILIAPGRKPRVIQTNQLRDVLQEPEILNALASVGE